MAKATQSNTKKRASRIPAKAMAQAMQAAGLSAPENKDQVLIEAKQGLQSSSVVGEKAAASTNVPVGRSWESEGQADAAAVYAAYNEAGALKVERLMSMGGLFHQLGWGESKGKKRKFHPQTESYFQGWTKFRDSLPEARQRSMNPRISEARRVMAGYLEHGKDHMDKLLSDKSMGYNAKIQSLKPRIERAADTSKDKDEKPTVATLKETQDATKRIQLVAEFKAGELGEIATGLTAEQFPVMAHALRLRALQFKDKACQIIGKALEKALAEVDKLDAKDRKAA